LKYFSFQFYSMTFPRKRQSNRDLRHAWLVLPTYPLSRLPQWGRRVKNSQRRVRWEGLGGVGIVERRLLLRSRKNSKRGKCSPQVPHALRAFHTSGTYHPDDLAGRFVSLPLACIDSFFLWSCSQFNPFRNKTQLQPCQPFSLKKSLYQMW